MLRIVIREKSGQQRELQVDKDEVVIGRVPSNDLPLPKNNVSKRHAKVVRNNGVWELVDMKSTNGTYVNGQRVDGSHRLSPDDQVIIGDFLLQFEPMDEGPASTSAMSPPSMSGGPGPQSFGPQGGFSTQPGPPGPPPGPMGPPPGPPPGPPGPPSPPPMTPPPAAMPPGGFGGPPPSGGPGGFGGPPSAGNTGGFGAQSAPPPPPPMSPPGAPSAPPPMTPPPGRAPGGPGPMGPPSPPPMSPGRPPGPPTPPPMPGGGPPHAAPPHAGPSFGGGPAGPGAGARPPAPPPIGGGNRLDSRPPVAPPRPPSATTPPPSQPTNELDELGDLGDLGLDEVDFDEVGEATDLPAPAVHAPPTVDNVSHDDHSHDASSSEIDIVDSVSVDDVSAVPDTTPPEEQPVVEEETPVAAESMDLASPSSESQEAAPSAPPTPPPTPAPEEKRPAPLRPAPATPPPAKPAPLKAPTGLKMPAGLMTPAPTSASSAPSASAAEVATPELPANLAPESEAEALAIQAVVQRLRREHGALVRTPLKPDAPERKDLKKTVREMVRDMRQSGDFERKVQTQQVIQGAISEAVGWGPIETFLEQEDVTAIMANGAGRIFVEKDGQFEATDAFFSSESALERAIQRMVSSRGIRVDRSAGAIEARLPDGTWLHAILPPIATQGISLILQPPRHHDTEIGNLVEEGLLSTAMHDFLITCMEHRRNILLAGDPGSGRTTLLNALSSQLPETERIVSVERVRELNLPHPHWIALETRAPDPQGQGGVSLSALIEHALRIRPQRLLLGDIEGNELHALMPRMLLGLDGVMMTARATSPEQLLYRLETLMLSSPEQLPRHSLSHQIGAAFDIVIQLNQYGCGTRKVTSVCELSCNHDGALYLNELFAFQKDGTDAEGRVQGTFEATGAQPQFYEDLARLGIELDVSLFEQG